MEKTPKGGQKKRSRREETNSQARLCKSSKLLAMFQTTPLACD
ncbi:MAG TPA: hypothetical protein VFC44_08000 [Candidatus Saccharimonadales bacterium]|nr:hypothetical protein [Candidatus Saccharimonadales bacterium]